MTVCFAVCLLWQQKLLRVQLPFVELPARSIKDQLWHTEPPAHFQAGTTEPLDVHQATLSNDEKDWTSRVQWSIVRTPTPNANGWLVRALQRLSVSKLTHTGVNVLCLVSLWIRSDKNCGNAGCFHDVRWCCWADLLVNLCCAHLCNHRHLKKHYSWEQSLPYSVQVSNT